MGKSPANGVGIERSKGFGVRTSMDDQYDAEEIATASFCNSTPLLARLLDLRAMAQIRLQTQARSEKDPRLQGWSTREITQAVQGSTLWLKFAAKTKRNHPRWAELDGRRLLPCYEYDGKWNEPPEGPDECWQAGKLAAEEQHAHMSSRRAVIPLSIPGAVLTLPHRRSFDQHIFCNYNVIGLWGVYGPVPCKRRTRSIRTADFYEAPWCD
ncbi:hypothetical protein TgHK011_007533 [Trichoderma gracile]|nr:hypothetical protein TgHK011_007533 [Trichoderma gracile]